MQNSDSAYIENVDRVFEFEELHKQALDLAILVQRLKRVHFYTTGNYTD